MYFKPEAKAQFLDLFHSSVDAISAFEGCRQVKLMEDEAHTNTLMTFSIWDSPDHLEQYRSSDFFRKTWAATKVLFDQRAEAWSMLDISPEPNQNH